MSATRGWRHVSMGSEIRSRVSKAWRRAEIFLHSVPGGRRLMPGKIANPNVLIHRLGSLSSLCLPGRHPRQLFLPLVVLVPPSRTHCHEWKDSTMVTFTCASVEQERPL